MKQETDTAIAIEFKKQLVKAKQSIDICKECSDFALVEQVVTCNAEQYTKESCNLIKTYM